MKRSQPPALATWLLEHARFSTTDGVIAGDLLEEFHTGRSAAWYWRQVLAAIVVGCARDARHHRVLATRAILISWAANYGALLLGRRVLYELFGSSRVPGLTIQLLMWAVCFLGGTTSGLIVALLHRRYRNAMLLTSAAALPGWALIAIMLLKRGALQQSPMKIAGATMVYYLVALTGFMIGGFLFSPAPPPATLTGVHPSPAR
jgi:hypothetical protein